MRALLAVILVLLCVPASNFANELNAAEVYSNAELGFSFTPPSGLRNLTASLKEKERSRLPDGRTHFSSELWMASGPDDTSADWVALGIETYPRGRDKDPDDDVTASFFTNNAALPGEAKERLVVRLSGQDFAVTRVEKKEPPLTKYGMVYTTVLKDKFVTFMFGGNDHSRVEKIAEAMGTFKIVR